MRGVLAFSLSILFSLTGFSQARIIEEAKYTEALKRAGEVTYSKPYRVKQNTEHCALENCVWGPLYRSINEIVPGGAMRSSFIDTQRGENEPSSVWVFIGNKRYVNRRNSGWQIEPDAKSSKPVDQKTELLSAEYRDLGMSRLAGKMVVVFQKATKFRLTYNGISNNGSQTITTWIDDAGMLLKQEFLSESSASGSTRIEMLYERDESIVIEDPIMPMIDPPAAFTLAGQGKPITRDEFWDHMRRSQAATRDKSFRTTVTIQHSDTPDGQWELYSSWVCDYVFPDRSHVLYTHRIRNEIVRIGKSVFSREPNTHWVRTEEEQPRLISSPAGIFGYPPEAQFLLTESDMVDDTTATLIRVVSKSKFGKANGKDTQMTNYWLDKGGILVRKESIYFNESSASGSPKWTRQLETYEYNSDIRVEPPIH
ncbi:MAG: hypothetical protein IT174_13885 [Acidobacteria bacterium]|nr:hypothetical protein [Acidobacteriota bacterium]